MAGQAVPSRPHLPLRTLGQLLECGDEIHAARCARIAGGIAAPCACGVPRLLAALAAVHGDQLGLELPDPE